MLIASQMAGFRRKIIKINWKGLRSALGMSQKELAHAIYIAPNVLWRHENGQLKTINPGTTILLRAFLRQPDVVLKLRIAGYTHPFPEDLE